MSLFFLSTEKEEVPLAGAGLVLTDAPVNINHFTEQQPQSR